jgi:hypothetical protein
MMATWIMAADERRQIAVIIERKSPKSMAWWVIPRPTIRAVRIMTAAAVHAQQLIRSLVIVVVVMVGVAMWMEAMREGELQRFSDMRGRF